MKQCSKCRSWDDCNGHDFFNIQEIRYCPFQICWAIACLITLHVDQYVSADRWPRKESGYTEAPPTQHSVSPHAPYEAVKRETGEIIKRLERTGKDGRLLVLGVHSGQSIKELSTDARWALGYVSGWRRKRQSYSRWRIEKSRPKNTQKGVFSVPVDN